MRIFNYNSKPMTILNKLSDLLLVNVLFMVFSFPVVTIGASQAGLCTAMKVFRDKEDDSSCFKAFFRGFSAGFGRVTLVWCVYLALVLFFAGNMMRLLRNDSAGSPTWIFAAVLLLLGTLEPLSVQFHARYVCTSWGLLKNALMFFMGNPIRAILTAALTWLPVASVFFLGEFFAHAIPVFVLIYFSVAYLLCNLLMDKPFKTLAKLKQETSE